MLTSGQVEQFQREGFVVLRRLAPAAMVRAMRAAAERDLEGAVAPVEYEADVRYPGAPADRDAPGGRTVRRLLRACERDPAFAAWALHGSLIEAVGDCLATTDLRLVQAHHNCVMSKHPRFSSATFWHQDIRYWRFQRNELVNTWTALGRESRDNGCMRVIPGSHRLALAAASFDQARFFRRDLPDNQALLRQAVRCELDAGDVLLFHSGLLHAAGRNLAGERKLSVVFTYRAADNPPLPGTRSASLPEIDPAAAS